MTSPTHPSSSERLVALRVEPSHRIPLPGGKREPMRVNVFERVTGSGCSLLPLFPYVGPGAIVPCGVVFEGGPDADYGQFFHFNTQDEVVLTLGAQKATLETGDIYVGGRQHGVNSFLRDQRDPEGWSVQVVTVHQPETGVQQEAITFRCSECNAKVQRFDFVVTPPGREGHDPLGFAGTEDDHVPAFATIPATAWAAEQFNDEEHRVCNECGHINDPFPVAVWGWQRYAAQRRIANAAKLALDREASQMHASAS